VADRAHLEPFQDSDFFLRRIARERHVRNRQIFWQVFKGPVELSLTFEDENLRTPAGLLAYQKVHEFKESQDLPGVCRVSHPDLIGATPPLPPRHTPNAEEYGHLHCSTDPPTKLQMEYLAKRATDHGVLLPFVKGRA